MSTDSKSTRRLPLRFSLDDAQSASDSWGFNCGPGALCAVLGMTPEEIRPHLGDFESKGYTNPTLMAGILHRLQVPFVRAFKFTGASKPLHVAVKWPAFGLVRIQWDGPWTASGVPIRARYRHTHWIGYEENDGLGMVFDVNAMRERGWLAFSEWSLQLVPWLLNQVEPKATGDWWPTHCWEIPA